MLGLCSLPTTQDPAELVLKPELLLQAWPQGLRLKYEKILRDRVMPRLYRLWESEAALCSLFLCCSSPSVSGGAPAWCG